MGVEGELTAEYHLRGRWGLFNNTSRRGELTYCGGYTSKAEERRIWRADRHRCVRDCEDEDVSSAASGGIEEKGGLPD